MDYIMNEEPMVAASLAGESPAALADIHDESAHDNGLWETLLERNFTVSTSNFFFRRSLYGNLLVTCDAWSRSIRHAIPR